MKTLTYDQALADLTEIVDADPDYCYLDHFEECLYFESGGPACIVGRVLARHGVTSSDVGDLNSERLAPLRRRLENAGVLSMNDDAFVLLRRAQAVQDYGRPWGEALAFAVDPNAAHPVEADRKPGWEHA